jgi:hypothetical protein
MPYRLEFGHLLEYDTREVGISIPIRLSHGQSAEEIVAKLDCGASACIFERAHGEALGIVVESGHGETFSTATGAFDAYGHFVALQVEGYILDVMVFFAKDETFNRNVLGRTGFLDRLLVGLNDYAGKLYLNRLDDIFDHE